MVDRVTLPFKVLAQDKSLLNDIPFFNAVQMLSSETAAAIQYVYKSFSTKMLSKKMRRSMTMITGGKKENSVLS